MTFTRKASMMLSYSIASTLICCSILVIYSFRYRRGNKIHFEDFILSTMLIVIAGLRYDVGSDYRRYLSSAAYAAKKFSDLRTLYSKETLMQYTLEVGYETLSVLTSRVFSSPYAIFWVIAVIIYIPIVRYCRKYTSNARAAVAMFLLFGFWGLSLNTVKQAVAMMLVLYAYLALERRKFVVFSLLSIIGVSFHVATIVVAIILLAVYSGILNPMLEPNRRNLLIMIVIGVIFRFGTGLIIRVVSRFALYTKYLSYLNAGADSNISRKYIMYGAFIETLIVICILYYAIRKINELKSRRTGIEKVISLIMIGLPFSIIGISRTLWLSNRFAEFFFLFLLVLTPELFEESVKEGGVVGKLFLKRNQVFFWTAMVGWHLIYAVLMLDNNKFHIQTYLFM